MGHFESARRKALIVVKLSAPVDELTIRPGTEHAVPVDTENRILELGKREARRIGATDHGTHGRSGNHVDLDAEFLKHAYYAHMRETAGAAAGKHEPDAGPSFSAACRPNLIRRFGICRSGNAEPQERERRKNG